MLTRRTSVQQQRYDPSPASHSQTVPEVLYHCQELNTDLGSIVSTVQKIQCFHLSSHALGTKQKKQSISSPKNENMPWNLSTQPRGDTNLGKVLKSPKNLSGASRQTALKQSPKHLKLKTLKTTTEKESIKWLHQLQQLIQHIIEVSGNPEIPNWF